MNKGKTLIEWSVVCAIAFLCLICLPGLMAIALEFQADKNVAYNFTAPIANLSNSSALPTGLNNTAFYVNSNDNTTYAAAATNVTHISNGVYLFQLNATEMNHDHVTAMYNGSSCWQFIPINTIPKEAIDTGSAYGSAINDTVNHATYGNSALNTKLGAPAGASVSADIAAVKSDSAAILTDTSAVDTTTEMRTFLTGSDTPLSTYAGGDTSGTTTLLSRLSATRAGYLDNLTNLDAAVSSRSTYAGADTAGTTTLLSRVVGTLAAGTHNPQSGDAYGIVNNGTYGNSALNTAIGTRLASASYTAPDNAGITNIYNIVNSGVFGLSVMKTQIDNIYADTHTNGVVVAAASKTGYGLTSAYDAAKTAAQASTAVSNTTWTDARALKLDNLDAAVSSRSTYAGADTTGTTTLLSRLSALRAGYLDYLSEMTELDGAVHRFTVNALEQGPAGEGGSGVADWTSDEKEQIRDALGITGTKTTASTGGIINRIDKNTKAR